LEVVAERGFARATLSDIVGRARVSRNVFYEQFADKEDCFVAACDVMAGELLTVVRDAAAAPGDWLAALRAGMAAYLGWWAAQAAWAPAYFSELPAAGARALEQRDRAYAEFEGVFADLAALARRERPELAPLPRLVPLLLVMAITEIVGRELRHGRGTQLGALTDELVAVVVRLVSDDRDVARLTFED
ncbi:MAG TPA: helix-turn-helix domain-containing protein, partial [Baekduia sp.]|nr:helix-turn-helix domain-containing protein [Baekduia sp.]